MRITNKLAVLVAVSALVGIAPAYAQGGAPDAKGDVSIDLDAAGLAPPAAPPPPPAGPFPGGVRIMTTAGPALPGMPDIEGDVMFMADMPDGPDDDVMIAMGPGPAVAMGGPGRGHMAFMHKMHRSPFADLNLTDDQYEKLWALKRDSMGKNAAKFGELMSAEMQLHDLLLQPEIDRTKIMALQGRINAVKADLANARVENKIATMSVLTAEQRHDLRRKMLERMAGGWGGGGGGKKCPPGSCPMKK